jgi:twitching motility protein PilI
MSDQSTKGFDALLEVARHSLQNASPLPAQIELRRYWSGVGFALLGQRLVVSLDEVIETLELPPVTKLPGVKPWVLGVANVRGRLLPISDVTVMLTGRQSKNSRQRVMVIENGDLLAGLLVDDVFGIQHFPEEDLGKVDGAAEELKPFVFGDFSDENFQWHACSIEKLVNESVFMATSAHLAKESH